MSLRAFPLLYINMAGEMIYILEQRLKTVAMEKSSKVLKDIISHIFRKKALEGLFQPQMLPHRGEVRHMFEKLAHSSIMKLNETSMDKLFDLMTMTSKYQVVCCNYAEQILMVTVNHLLGIKSLVDGDADTLKVLDNCHAMLLSLYRPVMEWEWCLIRASLLIFYQDCHVRVTLLVREGKQSESGTFLVNPLDEPVIIRKSQYVPGKTLYFTNIAIEKTADWPHTRKYEKLPMEDSYNMDIGGRTTNLGENLYRGNATTQIHGAGGTGKSDMPAGNELKLFENIIQGLRKNNKSDDTEPLLDLSMFEDATEENVYTKETESFFRNIQKIDASKNKKSLTTALSELKVDKGEVKKKKNKGADMLDLMDDAKNRPPTAAKRSTSVKARPASRESQKRESEPVGRSTSAKNRSGSAQPRTASSQGRPASKQKEGPPSRTPSATKRKPSAKNN